MNDTGNKKIVSNKKLLLQYASIGTQMLGGLALSVFIGKWVDEKIRVAFPLLIWLLPLVFIIGMIIKVVHDTSKKNNE